MSGGGSIVVDNVWGGKLSVWKSGGMSEDICTMSDYKSPCAAVTICHYGLR